jgi:hypothetical protein
MCLMPMYGEVAAMRACMNCPFLPRPVVEFMDSPWGWLGSTGATMFVSAGSLGLP